MSFFTSALTAAFGIGGGLTLLSLMIYLVPSSVLIPVHGLVQLGSNVGRTWLQRAHIDWRRLFPFLGGCVIGVAIGGMIVTALPLTALNIILALFILAAMWIKIPAFSSIGPWLMAFGGVGTAFATMFVGATGPLVGVFFKEIFTDRRALVASMAAALAMQHSLKVVAFTLAGIQFWSWAGLIVAMIISGYVGTMAGTRLLNRIAEKDFRKVFRVILTIIALDLLRRAIWA